MSSDEAPGHWLAYSTPVGKMANFDHQNKFQKISRSDRGYQCGLSKPKVIWKLDLAKLAGGPKLNILVNN